MVLRTTTHIVHRVLRTPVWLFLFVVAASITAVPIATPPVTWLPKAGDSGAILGTLLSAQAAIAALTLAVTLFTLQGVNARRDIDDRMHREYVRRSWVRDILWVSLVCVGVTGLVLLGDQFFSRVAAVADRAPGLRNLSLIAGFAFLINLVLAGTLFERAVRLSSPAHWQALRRDVNNRDARNAIRAFVARYRRALSFQEGNEPDLTILLPDPGEGSVDEAIRALLGDARRAMLERRHEEFRRSLDSIFELVRYAMGEIGRTDFNWSSPGGQAEWPPLRELSHNLYSFREDVIREGDRDHILELLQFDYRLIVEGMRERCGELFTAGLNGYWWNYQIANRIGGGEFREILRDRFSLNAGYMAFGATPVEAFPYTREMVRNQERLLSEAMHSDQRDDYDKLHRGFMSSLRAIQLDWGADNWPSSEASELYLRLEQEYRIALMGLAGRALFLAQANRISEVNRYLDVARQVYNRLGPLADDIPPALLYDDNSRVSLWQEWEVEGAEPYQTISIFSERYPLIFFALRLMELSSHTMSDFNLHGRAQRALDWFMGNSEWIAAHVREVDPISWTG